MSTTSDNNNTDAGAPAGHAHKALYENTNGFPMAEGKTLHMQTGHGDIANRVITVGSPGRAELIARLLDANPAPVTTHSNRGFLTITGYYKEVQVSIIAIGMGLPMMDFFVRETRAVVEGPMAMIRFGTCGGISSEALPGTIVVADSAALVTRNYDAFYSSSSSQEAYHFYETVPSNQVLTNLLASELKNAINPSLVVEGTDISADSFYSSQNRLDPNFDDKNQDVIKHVQEKYPRATSLEMETFMLYHLAHCCNLKISASAAAIVLANRLSSDIIPEEQLVILETEGGRAALNAIINFQL